MGSLDKLNQNPLIRKLARARRRRFPFWRQSDKGRIVLKEDVALANHRASVGCSRLFFLPSLPTGNYWRKMRGISWCYNRQARQGRARAPRSSSAHRRLHAANSLDARITPADDEFHARGTCPDTLLSLSLSLYRARYLNENKVQTTA